MGSAVKENQHQQKQACLHEAKLFEGAAYYFTHLFGYCSQMQPKGQLVHITFYNIFSKVLVLLAAFVLNIYASRHLSPQAFGQAQFITWVAAFTWTIFNLGLPGILARYVPLAQNSKQLNLLFRHSLVLLCIILALAACCIFFYQGIENGIRPICLALVLLHILNYYLITWLQGFLRFKTIFISQLVATVPAMAAGFWAIPHFGLPGYAATLILIHAIGVVVLVVPWARNLRSKYAEQTDAADRFTLADLYRTTLYLAPSAILAAMLWQRSEFYFMRNHMRYQEIGMYAVALTVVALFTEPLRMFTGTLTPYFASMTGRNEDTGPLFSRLYRYLWCMLVFGGAFLWFNAETIVTGLYGETYKGAAPAIRNLLPGFIPGVCSFIVMSLHVAMGRARFLFTQDLLSAVVLVVLVRMATTETGIEGVAVAKALAVLFSVILGLIYSVRNLHLQLPYRSMILSLALSVMLAFACNFLPVHSLFVTGICMVVAFVIYMRALQLTGVIGAAERKELTEKLKQLFR